MGWFQRLHEGLSKTRFAVRQSLDRFLGRTPEPALLEELEAALAAFAGLTTLPLAIVLTLAVAALIGGNLDAFTAKELVGFTAKVLDEHLATGFDVLSDLILHPLFRAEDIEKEALATLVVNRLRGVLKETFGAR